MFDKKNSEKFNKDIAKNQTCLKKLKIGVKKPRLLRKIKQRCDKNQVLYRKK